jgi:hypothetical protein
VRKDGPRAQSLPVKRCDSAQGPEWCESIIRRSPRRQKRCDGRGTGVRSGCDGRRARGSEPPDPTKGPYRWKTSRIEGSVGFYETTWRAVLAAPSPKGPAREPKRSRAVSRKRMHARKCVETEGKKERRQGCQRLGRIGHRGKKTPTPANEVGDDLGAGRSTEVESVFDEIRRSGSNVVKRSFPRSGCAEPKTPRSIRAMKVARVSRECARCGCSKVVRVADVGWTHRASWTPAGREAWW